MSRACAFTKRAAFVLGLSLASLACFAADLSCARRAAALDEPGRWEATSQTLSSPSAQASACLETTSALRFSIPEAGREMSWQQPLRPVWLESHHYLCMTYRAQGLSPTSYTPILRVRTGADTGWATVLSRQNLQTDGERHSQVIDLASLASSATAQVVGIELHLLSAPSSSASLVLEQLDFTDQRPGERFNPPVPSSSTTTYQFPLSTTSGWVAHPDWCGTNAAATSFSLASSGSPAVLSFRVEDASRRMKWSRPNLPAQDTATSAYALMRYRAQNLGSSASDYAIYLSGTGECRPFYHSQIIDDGAWHWASAPITIPMVNTVAAQVAANSSGEAFLEIAELSFTQGQPLNNLAYFAPVDSGWGEISSPEAAGFSPVDLSGVFNAQADQLLPRMGLDVPWFQSQQLLANQKVPLRVSLSSPNLACTELCTSSSLRIPLSGRSACELYMMLGAYLPAREESFADNHLARVDETERFLVEVLYKDGSSQEYFPVNVVSGCHQFSNNAFSVLACPADPAKPIEAVLLHDRTDAGLFALAALTLNTSTTPLYAQSFQVAASPAPASLPPPAQRAPLAEFTSPTLTLENSGSHLTLDFSQGIALSQWQSHLGERTMLAPSSGPRPFFSGTIAGTPFSSLDFDATQVEVASQGQQQMVTSVTLSLRTRPELNGCLSALVTSGSEIRFALALKNTSQSSLALEMRFPDLPELCLGSDPSQLFYAYPQRTFVCDSRPASLEQLYSGAFPVQFMDLFDPTQGWGVCLLVQDTELLPKYFGMKKSARGASLSLRYPLSPVKGLPAGEQLQLAPFSLALHTGDWHEAMRAYRQWAASWYQEKSPRQKWFEEIYSCRRDYPVNGSGSLFDKKVNSYTFDRELQDARRQIGGADMIDISSWAHSATYGRVGDYQHYELGGLDNFRSGIAQSQSQSVPVGLYFEGYLADRRSQVYGQNGPAWLEQSLTGADYPSGTYETRMCTGATGWQDYLASTCAAVASETGTSAVYLDQFGEIASMARCYRSDHNHAPGVFDLRGECETTRKVREKLNALRPGIPIYTEYSPVDFTSQYQDGSFAYTISFGDQEQSPTETNLFRFCFPSFKQIELVLGGMQARNWTQEGYKKAFMNGEGIWVKGELATWYDAQTRAFILRSRELFRDHRDAFTSDAAEPFVPTRFTGVYAHRFSSPAKQIYTLYNANWQGVFSQLLELGSADSQARVVDLWNEQPLQASLASRLSPRDIGCIGVFRKILDARLSNTLVEIGGLSAAQGGPVQIELVAVAGTTRNAKLYPAPQPSISIDLRQEFGALPEKLLVKLKDSRGVVIDEQILFPASASAPSAVAAWKRY